MPNEDCRPRPTLIAIGSPSFLFFPYYVTLHRCSGSIGYISPVAKTCVPDTTQVVRIRVNNLIRGGKQVLTKNNHTSCKPECTDKKEMCDEELEEWNEATCSCECKYPSGPPVPCPARFKYDITLLKYIILLYKSLPSYVVTAIQTFTYCSSTKDERE